MLTGDKKQKFNYLNSVLLIKLNCETIRLKSYLGGKRYAK